MIVPALALAAALQMIAPEVSIPRASAFETPQLKCPSPAVLNDGVCLVSGHVMSLEASGAGGPTSRLLTVGLDSKFTFVTDGYTPDAVFSAFASILAAAMVKGAPVTVAFVPVGQYNIIHFVDLPNQPRVPLPPSDR